MSITQTLSKSSTSPLVQMEFNCTFPPSFPAFSQTEAAFHDLSVICAHCYHSTALFFLLTPLEPSSPEPMAHPGGQGLAYSNQPSVGLHLWTTQEWQQAVARLGSGAHLCSLTCLGFPFLSALLQSHHAPRNLALRDLISLPLSLLPSPHKITGRVDFICLHCAAGVSAAGCAGSHGNSHANLHPPRGWPRMFSVLIFMSAPSVPVGCVLK